MKDSKYEQKIQELDNTITESKNNTQLYSNLRKKERYLRLIQEEVGMGGKLKDFDEENFD